ncbi:hypothetical protein ACQCQP_01735 [Ralstonia pseudosolanacearum]|uniref:hypothetical protein n=1 Tax=Ralstonia pseudosolanacearum TaxID=1310165 RepID=UPI003CFA2B27
MRISISQVFYVLPTSPSMTQGRAIIPAECEAKVTNQVVKIFHPGGDVILSENRFKELISSGSIAVLSE